jgi:hypothetical protein
VIPRREKGWLVVAPVDAHDLAAVEIAVGTEPDEWRPAYRDWDDSGARVAKIRPPSPDKQTVWIRINGEVTKLRSV